MQLSATAKVVSSGIRVVPSKQELRDRVSPGQFFFFLFYPSDIWKLHPLMFFLISGWSTFDTFWTIFLLSVVLHPK